jgi:hypothetical protein
VDFTDAFFGNRDVGPKAAGASRRAAAASRARVEHDLSALAATLALQPDIQHSQGAQNA